MPLNASFEIHKKKNIPATYKVVGLLNSARDRVRPSSLEFLFSTSLGMAADVVIINGRTHQQHQQQQQQQQLLHSRDAPLHLVHP